ncbi:hypothetical protein AAG906_009840 [Vitis piasezkii]
MEEEEAQEVRKVSGGGGLVEVRVGTSDQENINISISDQAESQNIEVLEGVSSLPSVVDEDQFEQVCLGDQEKNTREENQGFVDCNRSSNSGSMRNSNSEIEDDFASAHGKLEAEVDSPVDKQHERHYSSPGPERYESFHAMRQTFSSTSLDFAPARPKPVMPNVSPELLHLVDSAIMGKPESLDKLKNIVKTESIALLVVDSLLATMGGVESFEDDGLHNPPSVMLNSRAAIVAGELIPWLPWESDSESIMSPRTRMVRGLLAILQACTRNRAMCSMAGLLGVLLGSAERIFTEEVDLSEPMKWDGTPLCYCIQYLAGHSLSVIDLRKWFQVIRSTLTTVWATPLMLAMEKAMFDGESSGLLGPGESRWPFTSGYAFATWIYVESFADTLNAATAAAAIAVAAAAKSGNHRPCLLQLLPVHLLVRNSAHASGKKASLHFTHAFKPQCWYFIGLEHTCKHGLLGKAESELRLYIDGALYETRPFEFPRISRPLAFCCIGTNPPPTMAGLQRRRRQCPLFAEMGPVYIFKEPIGPEKMARLPWLATNDHLQSMAEESSLLDAEIAGCIHLLYHPNLLSGRFCPDASPSGSAGVYSEDLEVLGQVHVATRMRLTEALWALSYGGPMSLLPLAVCNVSPPLSAATAALAAPIFRIISVAIQHPRNNEELCCTRGPEILARILDYLLQTLSSLEIGKREGVGDEELVAAIVSLCQSQKSNHALKIWFYRVISNADANAIQMLLDGCRRCYWTIREKDSVSTFSLDEATRPVGEVNALVDELLVVIELLVLAAAPSLAVEDVRRLLRFMVDCPQPNQSEIFSAKSLYASLETRSVVRPSSVVWNVWVPPKSIIREIPLGWHGSFVGRKREKVWRATPLCLFRTI